MSGFDLGEYFKNNPFRSWLQGMGHWWGNGGGNNNGSTGGLGGDGPTGVYNGGVTLGVTPGAPYVATRQAPGVNELVIYQLENLPIARFDLTIRDLSGGGDLQVAEIGPGSVPNMIASGTLDVSHSRTACLPPKIDTDTTSANLATTWKGALHSVHLYNEYFAPIVGAGSTANKSLFKLDQVANTGTWEEDFTITPQTYSPPSHIASLSAARINSVLKPKILIGFVDDPARIISEIDGSPTADGTMHANTEPCWGAYESALNSVTPGASTILLYANGGIWSLSSTDAINASPTRTLDEVNNGGFIIGDAELQGSAIRLYIVEPMEDLGKTHMCDTNAATSGAPTALGRILSFNLEGSDPQYLDIGLDYVIDAKKWRGGIVATDGQTVMWHNGQKVNLGWNRERSWSSDAVVSISGLAVIGERLFVMVVERTASTSFLSFDEYILEENAWYPAFERFELSSGRFPVFVRETPTIHYFDRASATPAVHRFFYGAGLTSGDGITQWRSAPLWPSSYNPFYSQTTGNMPRNFAASADATLPIMHFFEGMPKIVSDITFMGQLTGTDSKVMFTVGSQQTSGMVFNASSQSVTFNQRDPWDKHRAGFTNPETIDRLQIKVEVTQGSSTRTTPNVVPFKVGGYIFFDNNVKLPTEIDDWKQRGF